jgi:hypothetical protein
VAMPVSVLNKDQAAAVSRYITSLRERRAF